ncbi:MFS transporter [Mycolicibacter hiberniae]|uniref:MFS transporter n=1 Tax=Mycolicibacter hiberniae TaxID=29314 RepID=A0A7I7X2D3_9MYCO|nr:MFS transporter [Mycolicibacter hiberniae]MCV7085414.1 MFS transporter [Mycolicibacter hiberniae]BBZ22418.1 MFS transporter [Mycolicibacter hiberniae]
MRPWIVWGTGLLSYLVAVLDRTTFGVSGLDAAERFHAGPSTLSSFVIVQLIVYAAMQIPAGVLLDRFGARAMIATGVAVLSAAQVTLSLTHSLPVAVGAYGVVGLGDSFIFISVIRLLPNWFAPERVPLLTQLTGICGQFGQFLSAVPFLAILLHGGWTAAYLSAAGLGLFAVALTLAVARDAPPGAPPAVQARPLRSAFSDVKTVWSRPGTKLGLFTHMGNSSSPGVFALMWGVPYLTTAQGLSRDVAGAALTLSVAAFVVVGLLVGTMSARRPDRRSSVALTMIALTALIWTVVLALPHPAPHWLLVVLILVISAGQPVSMLAFDFARTYNPPAAMGTAQGMVNTGGFIATLLVMQAMGLVIAMAGGYSFAAFRMAWTVQYVIWAVSAAAVVIYARKVRNGEPLGETHIPVAAAP